MSGGEVLAPRRQNHHAHRIVGFRPAEGFIQLHQQRSRLGVLRFGTVEPDPRDPPLVKGFVGHLLGCIAAGGFGIFQIRTRHSGPPCSLGISFDDLHITVSEVASGRGCHSQLTATFQNMPDSSHHF